MTKIIENAEIMINLPFQFLNNEMNLGDHFSL